MHHHTQLGVFLFGWFLMQLLLVVVVVFIVEGRGGFIQIYSYPLFLKGRVGERAEGGRRHGDETRTMKEMHLAHPGNMRGKQKGKEQTQRTVGGCLG